MIALRSALTSVVPLALVTLLSGCGATSVKGPATAAVLPDRGIGYDAASAGVLGGDPDSGCLWLEESGGGREQVLLVGDFEVDWTTEPPQVEKDGEPWAELGEFVDVGGGFEANEGVPACPVSPTSDSVFLIFLGSPRRRRAEPPQRV